MSYLIDGKRISRLTRDRLLVELERVDRERIRLLARVTEAIADEHRDAAALDMAETQRDQALHECEVLRAEQATLRRDFKTLEGNYERVLESRDSYKKESTDNWLKLTAAESALSVEQARVVVLRSRVAAMNRCAGFLLAGCFLAAAALILTACTASPTSPQPVCREYGFSPTSGRDTVYIVPCGGK